jgi:hypothetical protein
MIYYEYKLIPMDPFHMDAYEVNVALNDNGMEGFRFIGIHKLWTSDKSGTLVQADYLLLEKAEEEDEEVIEFK